MFFEYFWNTNEKRKKSTIYANKNVHDTTAVNAEKKTILY